MAMVYPRIASSLSQNQSEIESESSQFPHSTPIDDYSASTTATPNSNYEYDIFISYEGPDVKKGFAGHLCRRLRLVGLRVFLGFQEVQMADNFTSDIFGRIKTAAVHVAIFSPQYAESAWCLDELVHMCDSGSPIIPIYYNVSPNELQWTKNGVYADALNELRMKKVFDLQTLKEKPRYNSTRIEKWREALARVAEIPGFELEEFNGDEGELVDNVVEWVFVKLKKPQLNVAKHPTGMDEKVEDFENTVLFQHQSGKPQVVGIVGLGGVGKTTLAKKLFNRKSSYYSRCCFLYDVSENARTNSLRSLQIKLVKSLTHLTGVELQIESVHEGIEIFRSYLDSYASSYLSSYAALVILDGVDDTDQMDALLPLLTVLPSSSLILITSRHKDVLTRSGLKNSSIYKLTGLNKEYSLQLFCMHAFNHPNPLPEFQDLVDEFLTACNGLPLSLKMFGALLCGKNVRSYWEQQLDRLQDILPYEIEKIIKISYDALSLEEQRIFLDVACCFIGVKSDLAMTIWKGSGLMLKNVHKLYQLRGSRALLAFQSLQKKCFLEVDSENCINMHDHLKDLGIFIAEETGLRHRLWPSMENSADLLQQSSAIRDLRRDLVDLIRQPSVMRELRRDLPDLAQESSALREMQGNVAELLQQSSVITELQGNVADLLHQSSIRKEEQGLMILVLIMMMMILAMMIWRMP